MIDWIEKGREIEALAADMRFGLAAPLQNSHDMLAFGKDFGPTPAETAMVHAARGLGHQLRPLGQMDNDPLAAPAGMRGFDVAHVSGIAYANGNIYVRPEAEFYGGQGLSAQQYFIKTSLHELAHQARGHVKSFFDYAPDEETTAEMTALNVMNRLFPGLDIPLWSFKYMAKERQWASTARNPLTGKRPKDFATMRDHAAVRAKWMADAVQWHLREMDVI